MPKPMDRPQAQKTDLELVRMYYEHQYNRVERNEHHRLTISNYVLTLSALAFTFGFQNGAQVNVINGVGLPVIIIIANAAAISNIKYTATFIDVHRNRAHEVLQRYSPELKGIDDTYNFDSKLLDRRRKIEMGLHQLLILLSLIPLVLFVYQSLV